MNNDLVLYVVLPIHKIENLICFETSLILLLERFRFRFGLAIFLH